MKIKNGSGKKSKFLENKPDFFQEYELLQNIFYHLPGLIYWKNEKSQYMGFNENVVKLSGLTKEQLLGKTDSELNWGTNEAENFRNDDQEIMSTGITHISEYVVPIKRSDGCDTILRTVKSPLYGKDGNVIGILAVAIDITAEKMAEEREKQVIKKAALETAEAETAIHLSKIKAANEEEMRKTVMTLVGDIVHDLKTPIATITGAVQILETVAPGLIEVINEARELKLEKLKIIDDAQLNYVLNKMSTAQKNSVRMINEFIKATLRELAVAQKYQDGAIAYDELTKCSIRRVLENVMEGYPRRENLVINQCFPYDFFFMGNSILMMKVLFNLIRNAEEQIIANGIGEITITTREAEDNNLLIVKDTAGGAPPEVVDNLFKDFFTTKKDGTGIGLAYCKKMMRNFDGDISCYSVFGESIEFILSFPKIPDTTN